MIFKFSTMFILGIENIKDDLKILKIIRNIFNTPFHLEEFIRPKFFYQKILPKAVYPKTLLPE